MYTLKHSEKKTKKYDIITPENKIISFGAKGMSDYTINKDSDRRDLYINRHQHREAKYWNHDEPITPSYLSRFLLWEKPNLNQAILNI